MTTAEKIKNARKALSALGGQVSEETWSVIKCIQHELDDAADQAEQLEAALEPSLAAHASGGNPARS